jgi:ubiquitin-conjugating enzyme E2 variant
LLSWLLADFITGIIHWLEDKCLSNYSEVHFLQTVIDDNNLHHENPSALCDFSLWRNIDTSVAATWPICTALYFLNAPQVLYMAIFFASFANIIHRYSHETKSKIPKFIRILQNTGIICSKKHHFGHHYFRGKILDRGDAKVRYCVMTNWLNPILDYIKFFPRLEALFNIKRDK